MELIRHEIPFESRGYLELLGRIFGQEEADLERIQVNGSENAYNEDIAFTVEDGGEVLGTSHITFSGQDRRIAGLSGLCTDPRIRGTGMGKKLFGAMVEEADAHQVEASFLGTNNPMAAELYAGFGYAYIPGTYTMARFSGTNRFRFFRRFLEKPERVEIRKLDPGFRIPVVPLLLNEGPGFLMDSNAGIFNNREVTQVSTMGLYPKYLEIARNGGEVFGLCSADGLAGGLVSVRRGQERPTADFFVCPGFSEESIRLIRAVREAEPEAVFAVSEADSAKQEVLLSAGWKKTAREKRNYGNIRAELGIWETG